MAGVGRWFLVLAVGAPLLRLSSGHGRLMEPPSRSSMWRQGFPSPINYADNQLFCGGFKHQWEEQQGRCGVCGDPYDGPRDHEPGGKFYTGITTRTFTRGQVVDIEVELTAFHYGYFEFRLCPLEYINQTVGQDCFDKYLLKLVTPSESGINTRYKLPSDPSIRMVKVKATLPAGVTCEQCVLQWKYHAANSWGDDFITGRGCVGCGPQEEFYGCADVTILTPDGTVEHSPHARPSAGPNRGQKSAAKAEVLDSLINQTIKEMMPGGGKGDNNQQDDWSGPWTRGNTASTYEPQEELLKTWMSPEPKSLDSLKDIQASLVGKCQSTGAWKGQAAMDDWCELNCERGNCPSSHCLCDPGDDASSANRQFDATKSWSSYASPRAEPVRWQDQNRRQRDRSSQWALPQERSVRMKPNYRLTRHSYLQSRPPRQGGIGFRGAAHRAPTNNRAKWREPVGRSNRGYTSNHPQSNSIPTEENMEQILAYSQMTFNSIKDHADAVYRSLMKGEGRKSYAGFLENYKPYGGPRRPTNALYDPSAQLYMKRPGQNPHPWTPQPRSNSLVYNNNNRVYHGFAPKVSSREQYHGRGPNSHRNSNYDIFNDRKSSDGDLIAKAQFVDSSHSTATNSRSKPQPKMASRPEVRHVGRKGNYCIANGAWTGQAAMTKWCQDNCAVGNCPGTHCKCP